MPSHHGFRFSLSVGLLACLAWLGGCATPATLPSEGEAPGTAEAGGPTPETPPDIGQPGLDPEETITTPSPTGEQEAAQALEQGMALYQRDQFEEALPLLQRAARAGHADACHALGRMYQTGRGVPQNFQAAANWYYQAAKQGDANAQYRLARLYYEGEGVKEDSAKAYEWFQRAAEQGHGEAQFELGWIYEHGEGEVTTNLPQAATWYRKAAERGVSNAQYNLGVMYAKGDGVSRDFRQAAQWYQAAARQGHFLAQYNLGVLYYDGRGLPRDTEKAVYWTREAARQGFAPAQYNLGVMYQAGEGAIRDWVKAYTWFTLAADQDDDRAAQARDILGQRLTKPELDQARRWRQVYYEKRQEQPRDEDSGLPRAREVAEQPAPSSPDNQDSDGEQIEPLF